MFVWGVRLWFPSSNCKKILSDHQLFLNKQEPCAHWRRMKSSTRLQHTWWVLMANREETLICLVLYFSPLCQTWYFNLDPSRVRTTGYCGSQAAVLSLTLPDNAASLQITFRKVENTFLIKPPVTFTPLLQYICIYFSHNSFGNSLLSGLNHDSPNLDTWIWMGWYGKVKTGRFMKCISYFTWHKPYKWFSYRICCNA